MRTEPGCIPCLLRQAVEVGELAFAGDAAGREAVLREALRLAQATDWSLPPPLLAQALHRWVRARCGADPYRAIKDRCTAAGLRLLPDLQRRVEAADDPLGTALRLAAAGNILDAGLVSDLSDAAVDRAIAAALACPLDPGQPAQAVADLRAARRIVYLADNCGELVLDRLVLGLLGHAQVTLVVKGRPILNDATREDVVASGLTGVDVVDNGDDAPGTVLASTAPAVRALLTAADLVVSKGQGNYETLVGHLGRPFLAVLTAKCVVVARELAVPLGSVVVRTLPG